MKSKEHNSKVFPEWEKYATENNLRGICVVCADEKNQLQVMAMDGITIEALKKILSSAASNMLPPSSVKSKRVINKSKKK